MPIITRSLLFNGSLVLLLSSSLLTGCGGAAKSNVAAQKPGGAARSNAPAAAAKGSGDYTVSRDAAGKPHGPASYRWPGGKKKATGAWDHGKQDGEWQTWRRDGSRESAGSYDGGVKTGKWTFWSSEGAIERQAWFLVGELTREGRPGPDGTITITALALGVKSATWSERNGNKHGIELIYHPGTTTVASKATWVDGVADGPASWHREDGSVVASGVLAGGKRLCGWRYFDAQGNETTRRARYAKAALAAASGAQVPADNCKWTLADALTIHAAGEAPATIAIARWLFERTVEQHANETLSREPPGETAQIAAIKALAKDAKAAGAAFKWREAALQFAAAIVAVDSAQNGELLSLAGADDGDAGGASDGDAFKAAGGEVLEQIRVVLWATEGGDKADRKAGRVILGRVGVDKIAMRNLVKRMR